MSNSQIVLLVDQEIRRLQDVKNILTGAVSQPAKVNQSKSTLTVMERSPQKHHIMSAEGRKRISEAQKARWAKTNRHKKAA